jgi:hypothetical protein
MLMIAGAGLAISNLNSLPQNTIAASVPHTIPTWNIVGNRLPLDLQLDLDKKASGSRATSKDSINIIDSVRWVTKTRWKTRYRNVARITHSDTGNEMAAVTPDSLSAKPVNNNTLGREEYPKDNVGTSKVSSIQLTVDGEVVYSKNDNHSGVEGQ